MSTNERARGAWTWALVGALIGASVAAFVYSRDRTEPRPVRAAAEVADAQPDDRTETGRKTDAVKPAAPARVDPRSGGLEIVLGEWAITPEVEAIRPGKVTFLIHNRGTMGHGYEIEIEGESSGSGSGSLFKAESELLGPGDSTRMTMTLAPGLYKIECLVDGHDDMGMEGFLEVRSGAPLVKTEPKSEPGSVAIADFAFAPDTIEVEAGTEITWRNDDPTDHTVTSFDGDFGSDSLAAGDSFSRRFTTPGTHRYRCAIHPDMQGTVKVR